MSPTSGKDWLQRYEKRAGKKHPTAETKPARRGGTPGMGFDTADPTLFLMHGPVPSSSWMFAKDRTVAKIKTNVVNSLSEATGVDTTTVNDMLATWIYTSNDQDPNALSMQEAAAKEFGVPLSDWQKGEIQKVGERVTGPVRSAPSRNDELEVLKAMRDNTQAEFARQGYKPGDTLTLYRGMTLPPDPARKVGSVENYKGGAIESWSAGKKLAKDFATRSDRYYGKNQQGVVLSMRVPIENIIGTAITGFGVVTQGEYVILGSVQNTVSIEFAT